MEREGEIGSDLKTKGGDKKKMKKKTLVLVEIAIVLCSMFLVGLPATVIAADQTTQKTSACLSMHITASEDDFTLPIYGNANEDDTINMGDVIYTKLIILGKKSKTEFADANYDGKVSMLDVGQTKLIILRREKRLTLEDAIGKVVTVSKPLKRIVVPNPEVAEIFRALNAEDKVIGVSQSIQDQKVYLPEFSYLPLVVTGRHKWDYDTILCLNPDAVITSGMSSADHSEKLPGIPVIHLGVGYSFGGDNTMTFAKWVSVLGYSVDSPEEAEILYHWYCDELNNIESQTKGLSEDDKPRVLTFDHYNPGGAYWIRFTGFQNMTLVAGARNIAEGLTGQLDPDWIKEEDPEFIIALVILPSSEAAYEADDLSKLAVIRDDILNREELAGVTAVKKKQVFVMPQTNCNVVTGATHPVGTAYMANWFHPTLFQDLDPRALHQEYLDRFHEDLNYNVYEHGVFVYPREQIK